MEKDYWVLIYDLHTHKITREPLGHPCIALLCPDGKVIFNDGFIDGGIQTVQSEDEWVKFVQETVIR